MRKLAVVALGVALAAGCPGCSSSSAAVVAPLPSAGCTVGDQPAPADGTYAFSAAGKIGSYLLDVPAGVPWDHPLPLVVDLHGYAETAVIQDEITGLGAYGQTHGFVSVTPQVDDTVPHWDYSPGSADQAFVADLFGHLADTLCLDRNRLYLAGYSNGAFMTSWLACSLAGTVAAVATVAGIQAPAGCHPARPVPVIAFHGTADPFVPYQGGVGPAAADLPAPDGKGTIGSELGSAQLEGISPATLPIPIEAASWARRNGCGVTPTASSAAPGVTLLTYPCPTDAAVVLYRENGDGHIWAGSPLMVKLQSLVGPTTSAISDDSLIWSFFEAHPFRK